MKVIKKFSFEVIWDLQKNWKYRTEFLYTLYSTSSNAKILCNHEPVKPKKLTLA